MPFSKAKNAGRLRTLDRLLGLLKARIKGKRQKQPSTSAGTSSASPVAQVDQQQNGSTSSWHLEPNGRLDDAETLDLDQMVDEVYNEIIDHVIYDTVIPVRRLYHSKLTAAITGDDSPSCLDFTPPPTDTNGQIVSANPPDIYGNRPDSSSFTVTCETCQRTVAASRYAPHLEKCMGMGRNSSRVARKRISGHQSHSSAAAHQNGGVGENLSESGGRTLGIPNNRRFDSGGIDSDGGYVSSDNEGVVSSGRQQRSKRGRSPSIFAASGGGSSAGNGGTGSHAALVGTLTDHISAIRVLQQNHSRSELRAILANSCGAVMGGVDSPSMCRRSLRCPLHSAGQREDSRRLLLRPDSRGNSPGSSPLLVRRGSTSTAAVTQYLASTIRESASSVRSASPELPTKNESESVPAVIFSTATEGGAAAKRRRLALHRTATTNAAYRASHLRNSSTAVSAAVAATAAAAASTAAAAKSLPFTKTGDDADGEMGCSDDDEDDPASTDGEYQP
eukprot:Clim_evm79s146 gene=Clim_evmTU79s146